MGTQYGLDDMVPRPERATHICSGLWLRPSDLMSVPQRIIWNEMSWGQINTDENRFTDVCGGDGFLIGMFGRCA